MGIKMTLEHLSPEYQRQALEQMGEEKPRQAELPRQAEEYRNGCLEAVIIVISFVCLVITGELWRD
jgi:hypothetical protein